MDPSNNFPHSFYITPKSDEAYVISASPLEQKNSHTLAATLLHEFNQSSEKEKAIYKPILEEWLKSMEGVTVLDHEEQKVRDLIYEMF